jgi:hypothetical protein
MIPTTTGPKPTPIMAEIISISAFAVERRSGSVNLCTAASTTPPPDAATVVATKLNASAKGRPGLRIAARNSGMEAA